MCGSTCLVQASFFLFAGDEDQALNGNYFNWTTLFGSNTGNLSNDGAVAYLVKFSPPPLPGRSLVGSDEAELVRNFNRSLRLNANALTRESEGERQKRLLAEKQERAARRFEVSKTRCDIR